VRFLGQVRSEDKAPPSVTPLKIYARRQFETFGRAFREPDAPFPNRRQMDSAEFAGSFEESGFR
jgi:hypothetical protein